MALKFNNMNKKIYIKPVRSQNPLSRETGLHMKTVKKRTERLTLKSKNILRKLGYQLKQNA